MRKIAREHRWLAAGIIAAFALTLFFLIRLTLFAIYWWDPAHRDQPLRGWMNPGLCRPLLAHSSQ